MPAAIRKFRDPVINEIAKFLVQDASIPPNRWRRYQRHLELLDNLSTAYSKKKSREAKEATNEAPAQSAE